MRRLLYKQPETYLINLENSKDENLPVITRKYINRIKDKFENNIKISDFPQLLETALDRKFELFDEYFWNKAEFTSYLMDKVIDFKSGKDVDMSQLHTDIITAYDFTREEKRMFLEISIEDALWAIFILLNNPAHARLILNNND